RKAISVVRMVNDAHADVMGVLEKVGLDSRSGLMVNELSHGDKRKLELAVSIARGPSVLLLDEPVAGVSMEEIRGITDIIGSLRNDGVTVCMVEHHIDVVLELADAITVLDHGSVLATGRPDEITDNPLVR